MSNDLISREWLEDAFDNICCHNCKICRNFRNEDSFYKCSLIENAPTVDTTFREVVAYECGQKSVEEQPKGKWENTIPENPTNGDMLLTMFDAATVYGIDKENDCIAICMDNNFYQKFRYSWWNAPYKRGDV